MASDRAVNIEKRAQFRIEQVDLAVGPNNSFEPGGDRGQPTHFVPRRH